MGDVALRPGSVIDERFTLKRLLGAGGCGAVWLASDRNGDDTELVLKILHAHFDKFSQGIRQLEREAGLLAQLAHPNIAKPLFFSVQGPHKYLAMEFVDGRSLDQEIGAHTRAEEYFSRADLSRIFEELASAVAHAHSRTIIHRDLKPQNIMVTRRDGVLLVKVLDFGIAKLLEGNLFDATTFGRRLGSMFYMSPEQCQGEPADVRSDIFALGAILFEMLTLRRAWVWDQHGRPHRAFDAPVPADGSNALSAVLLRVVGADRPRPRAWRPELPERFDGLIARAMAIEPSARFRNVEELLDEFRLAVAELEDTLPKRPKTTRERLEVPARRALTPAFEPRPQPISGRRDARVALLEESDADLDETLRKVRAPGHLDSTVAAAASSAALATRVDERVFQPPPYAGPRIEAETEVAAEFARTRLSAGLVSFDSGSGPLPTDSDSMRTHLENSASETFQAARPEESIPPADADATSRDAAPPEVFREPPEGVYPTREIERPSAFLRSAPSPAPPEPVPTVAGSPVVKTRPKLPARPETLTSIRGPKLVAAAVVGMVGAFAVGIVLARWAAGAMQMGPASTVSFAGRAPLDEAAIERYAHLDALLEAAEEQPEDTQRWTALRDGIIAAADDLPSEEERTQVKRAAGSSASTGDLQGLARCIDRLRQAAR